MPNWAIRLILGRISRFDRSEVGLTRLAVRACCGIRSRPPIISEGGRGAYSLDRFWGAQEVYVESSGRFLDGLNSVSLACARSWPLFLVSGAFRTVTLPIAFHLVKERTWHARYNRITLTQNRRNALCGDAVKVEEDPGIWPRARHRYRSRHFKGRKWHYRIQ